MARSVLRDLARQRLSYTNEGYRNALEAVRSLPSSGPLIPRAVGDQELFEAAVFSHLLKPCHFGLHPLRIAAARPYPEHLVLVIDSSYHLVFDVLRDLLPVGDRDGAEVHGVEGLRIRRWRRDGLDLHQPGRRTAIRLIGAPQAIWRRAEQQIANDVDGSLFVPCWRTDPAGWTAGEVSQERDDGSFYVRIARSGAWLASGLLRRVAIFHTTAVPWTADGWRGLSPRLLWKFDLACYPDLPLHMDEVAAALTHSRLGLPVRAHPVSPRFPNVLRLSAINGDEALELHFMRWEAGRQWMIDPDCARTVRRRAETVVARLARQ
ncbi:hypothetical protein F4556_006255 [Kitasatospora gansuensis]|uniref:Uncharacterized protein n=1 Tax=Kitasatospora gansuensis TaxID=258050 RepID=A0A7W7SHR9_9ACTN|nr:hypothetical protein [Kitasatospora gansuensis]MBB4950720.1 hypothetical protein [Kitasatospora gansuensis]